MSHFSVTPLALTVALLLCSFSGIAHATAIRDDAAPQNTPYRAALSTPNLGMSEYHYFISYPHLEKAQQAMKDNDGTTAIAQLEHVHSKVPDNIPVILFLAEAYRHFGYNEKAVQLLHTQLMRDPHNQALREALDAIPITINTAITRAELFKLQDSCNQTPTLRCRALVGQTALHLGVLSIAQAQLADPRFASTAMGKTLKADLQQRAIYLKQWSYVEAEFDALHQQGTLTAQQAKQWFEILLLTHDYKRIQQLQTQGMMNTPAQRLAFASALAQHKQLSFLHQYLAQTPPPKFSTAEQEQGWLYLLSRYSTHPQQAIWDYSARFRVNQDWIADQRLQSLMQDKDYRAAQRFIAGYPANRWLETRFALSLLLPGNTHSLALARQLYRQQPNNPRLLDILSYRLMQAGKPNAAIDLLLQYYPYATAQRSRLAARLFELLDRYPQRLTSSVLARLSRPLPDMGFRLQQVTWLASRRDCSAVTRLLGDFSTSYSAVEWDLLGNCYQKQLPGVALYAYQQSEQRHPSRYNQLAIAYQAAAVQNFALAEQAWQDLPVSTLSDTNIIAAANTAHAVGNMRALNHWLSVMRARNMTNVAEYWWLMAQYAMPSDPNAALLALNKALQLQPQARFYAARATLWQRLKQDTKAMADLQQAHRMEPHNANYAAELGYALFNQGDYKAARTLMMQALEAMPDDPNLIRQLAYVNQRLGNNAQTLLYAAQAIADIDNAAAPYPLSESQQQEQFALRSLYTEIEQRWVFTVDGLLGLQPNALMNTNNGNALPGKSYRSYGQLQASYRLGQNQLRDGDTLFAYSRIFAGSGENGHVLPVKEPMLGVGIRWKPFFNQTLYLAAEQQLPLSKQSGKADVMLRASASLLNNGQYSDAWHPTGKGWFAHNLYLDAAYYLGQHQQAYTADYRASWHQKVANGQTIEPYAHLQYNSSHADVDRSASLIGVGVRWNVWHGQSRDEAWTQKFNVGIEYQRPLSSHNSFNDNEHNVFITFGGSW